MSTPVGWPPPGPPQPPEPVQPERLPFHLLHRLGRPQWWWTLLSLPALFLLWLVVFQIGLFVAFLVPMLVSGMPLEEASGILTDIDDPRPLTLAFVNLSLASAIPAVFLVQWALHGLRPGWVTSVAPRMRWGFFVLCAGLAIVALVASVTVSYVLPVDPGGEMSGTLNDFTSTTRDFLLVVLLLTPFQAAGEEYLFRGYLTQAVGTLAGSARWLSPAVVRGLAVVVPALLFAIAHGSQSFPIFFDRFAFGLVAGVLVIATGGLEAGIAMHILNNWVAFGLTLAYGDMASALTPSGGNWWMILSTLTQSLTYLALVLSVARRIGLVTTARVPPRPQGPPVLAADPPGM